VLEALVPFVDGLCESWSAAGASVGAIVAGHLGAELAARLRAEGVPGLRLLVEHPLPEARIVELLQRCESVAVLEEGLPWLEQHVREIAQRHALTTNVVGRRKLGDPRPVGWLSGEPLESVLGRLRELGGGEAIGTVERAHGSVPAGLLEGRGEVVRARYEAFERDTPLPGFPESDPRRALFSVLRELGAPRPTFVATDPGITGVLALASAQTDVKMQMGCAVPIAAGWSRARSEGLAIAVVGDTNLAHSELNAIVESAAADDQLLVVVVDNGASEMTQSIVTLRPRPEQAMQSLAALGCRVSSARLSGDPGAAWALALRDAAAEPGMRVVWLFL
jgi:TPP-dependent indolepyruvate ferredoxin oxidoreductase alpha subunit